MSKRDWDTFSTVATVGGALVALHGITSGKWSDAHKFFLVLSLVAAIGPHLQES